MIEFKITKKAKQHITLCHIVDDGIKLCEFTEPIKNVLLDIPGYYKVPGNRFEQTKNITALSIYADNAVMLRIDLNYLPTMGHSGICTCGRLLKNIKNITIDINNDTLLISIEFKD